MFTEKCFIRKNTKELQDKLSKLGYANYYDDERSSNGNINDGSFLFVDTYIEYDIKDENIIEETPYYCCVNTDDFDGTDYGIDCGEDEEMFFAIAALQDNIDINQLFKMDIEALYTDFPKGSVFKATKLGDGRHVGTNINPFYCHKLSVEEIIEYFKK
mgnify:CR=1 FL=1